MKTTALVLAAAIWTFDASWLFAQPVLNRVEQFLRDQLGAPRDGAAPADRPATEAGYLGLVVDDRQEPGVVRVVDVVVGAAAAQAGLQKGDIIAAIDGRPVRTTDDVARAVEGKPSGAKLIIAAAREGNRRDYNLTLGRRPAPATPKDREELPKPSSPTPGAGTSASPPRLGVRTLPVTDEARRQNNLADNSGALVIFVAPGSPADAAGIPLGAVIKAVGDAAITSPQELAAAIGRVAAGSEVELSFVHQGVKSRKRVSLAATNPEEGRIQLRARPRDVPAPAPSEGQPSGPDATARIAALEARVRALEDRIKELESRLEGAPAETEKPQ